MGVDKQLADQIKSHARLLLADFSANGGDALRRMNGAELLLLLSEKQLHLGLVSGRCEHGEGLHVNVPLKKLLERDVKEIQSARKAKERDLER
jgi:hypothetical protein